MKRLEQHSTTERQALTAARLVGGSAASHLLQQGDILLAIDDKVVTRFRDVERAVGDQERVKLTVWRGRAAQTIERRPTSELPGTDIDRVVQWAGATLQAPHRAMSAQRGIPPVGVYVAYFSYGSPSTRYGLYPGTPDRRGGRHSDAGSRCVPAAVTGRADRSSVRLKTITWNNAPEVITLKLDKHYWPAYELRRTDRAGSARPSSKRDTLSKSVA